MATDKYGMDLARELGAKILSIYSDFPLDDFLQGVADPAKIAGWANLIAASLRDTLPADYPTATNILLQTLGPEHPIDEPMHDAYKMSPAVTYVARYGLEHFDLSMHALYEMAKRSLIAQAGLRYFIVHHYEPTMALLQQWAQDENPQIRRLVSGGTRPRFRLRAGMPSVNMLSSFIEDPRPLLDLLKGLTSDSSRVVRISVAGNLSDIIKDNPDIAYDALRHWQKDANRQTAQTIRNALRYAIKKGDPRALELI